MNSQQMELTPNEELMREIEEERKTIKTDRMDISFGEIINMYKANEIIINPEYQRAFRWSQDKQTAFIESILLGIPFPPIFVIEDKNNVWELVDGLQRISSILAFFGELSDEEKNNLTLVAGDLIKKLDGFNISSLPKKYALSIKRATCRVEIIRAGSDLDMRYELFKRLNTGGEELSRQEIRNCIFRSYGNELYEFVNKLSQKPLFQQYIKISEMQIEKKYYQELVLRYLSLKNNMNFDGQLQDHMDKYLLMITKNKKLNIQEEEIIFDKILDKINSFNLPEIFKLNTLKFSTSVFDALFINFGRYNEKIDAITAQEIESMKNDNEFRKNTGPASSSQYRVPKRIERAAEVLRLVKDDK